MKRKAFTLVEILVCIAIICVLAALLFTAGRSALDSSRASVCTSNLHQLTVALNLYKTDTGEYPPSNDHWEGLMPYLSNTRLHCPYRDIAQSKERPDLRVDYFVNGHQWNSADVQAERDCMTLRGSSFPLAYDDNHASPYVAQVAGKSFYIYGRIDGSVARVDYKKMTRFYSSPATFPCPGTNEFYNFP